MNEIDKTSHLRELELFFADRTICRDSFRLLIDLAVRLAAHGCIQEVLTIVQRSPEASLFQPLADGLRLHLGLPLGGVGQSLELAAQIADKITAEIKANRDTRSIA